MESNKLNENLIVELDQKELTEISGGGFWKDVGNWMGDQIYEGRASIVTGPLWYSWK